MFVKAVVYRFLAHGVQQSRLSRRSRQHIAQELYENGDQEIGRTIDRIGFGDATAAAAMRELLEELRIGVILNKVQDPQEEKFVAKLRNLTRKYVDLDLDFLGSIPFDPNVKKSLNDIVPFALEYQLSPANVALKQIAMKTQASLADRPSRPGVSVSISSGSFTRMSWLCSAAAAWFRGIGSGQPGQDA
jgi:hypothetical protein